MKNWFNWKQLWWNLKYAYTDWRNSLQRDKFKKTIVASAIVTGKEAQTEPYNVEEVYERTKNSIAYFENHTRQLDNPDYKVVYRMREDCYVALECEGENLWDKQKHDAKFFNWLNKA